MYFYTRVSDKKMKDFSVIKKTGATFTPSRLAGFLSSKLMSYCGDLSNKIVVDPACGEGSLLISIAERTNLNIEKLVGFDTNKEYLFQTQKKLKKIGIRNYELKGDDFLEISSKQNDLFYNDSFFEYADVIIANPPYVRTQNLGSEKSKQIAKRFNLTGKVDLYYPFLIGMTNILKKGGFLGVITSNRYLTTKSGSDIRKFLLDNYDILEVIDLGDSQLFDAEVRLFDRLFAVEAPEEVEEGKTFLDNLNPNSLQVLQNCKLEPYLANSKVLDKMQFERLGYFCVDKDSTPEHLVFNRACTLKDSWAKING